MSLVVMRRGDNAMMRLVSHAVPLLLGKIEYNNRSQALSSSIGRALTIIHANTDLLSSLHLPRSSCSCSFSSRFLFLVS